MTQVAGSTERRLIAGLSLNFQWPGSTARQLSGLVADYDPGGAPMPDSWTIAVTNGEVSHVSVDAPSRSVSIRAGRKPPPRVLVQEAVTQVLLMSGRLPIHAALIAPAPTAAGLLLIGDSGRGKSSLVRLAIAGGWSVVSDDLVALHTAVGSHTVVGGAIRRRLRIVSSQLDEQTRSLGLKMTSLTGLAKTRLDPNALAPGSFLAEAPIGRLVFLDRATSRSITPISPADAAGRLLSICAPALAFSKSRLHFKALADLARQSDARVANFTRACLSDPDVLAQISA